jgi:asparagine synthase (glutamine-hydrolysing)
VLAIATSIARREGLPEPIPITRVFPRVATAQEDEWQEEVVRHLRLREWERLVFEDELDLVGPLATEGLREHGVLWPPMTHVDAPLLARLSGGTLLDGEGGDDVLGVDTSRIAPLAHLLRAPRPLRWRRLRSALGVVAPYAIRKRHVRDHHYGKWSLTWLRPEGQEALLDALSDFTASEPLSFAASVRAVPRLRMIDLGMRNRRVLAKRRDVIIESPFLHPDVVHALAREGGWLGPGTRTQALQRLVGDLLPTAVIQRTSKASFGAAYLAGHTLAFAERWNGTGVDHSLVDASELRRIWRAEERNAHTSSLLQAAWLASHNA